MNDILFEFGIALIVIVYISVLISRSVKPTKQHKLIALIGFILMYCYSANAQQTGDSTIYLNEDLVVLNNQVIRFEATSTPLYSDEYQALLDKWIIDPHDSIKLRQDSVIIRLKDSLLWNTLDFLHIYANVTNANGEALTDWSDPDSTATNNGCSFTSLEGLTGNSGSNADINTNYNPTDDAVNLTQNSASFGFWFLTDLQEGGIEHGANDGTNGLYISSRETFDFIFAKVNSSATMQYASATDGSGLWGVSRTGAATIEMYRNGSSIATDTDASSLPDGDVYIHWDGQGTDYSDNQVACDVGASGWDDDDWAAFYWIIGRYLDYIEAI